MNEGKATTRLEEVILKYWPQVSFRVRKSLGHFNPDWEDVASEVILDVIAAVRKRKFRGESSLGTFIYVITSRRIIDYIRNRNRKIKKFTEFKEFPKTHQEERKKEQAKLIINSLRKLRPLHAELLYLQYYMGMSQKEIARAMGFSQRWTHEVIREAKNALRKVLTSFKSSY